MEENYLDKSQVFIGQEYVQKKNIIGTREFMSPEVLAGYVIENGEVDREAMMESEGVK